jgi:hypothetical protein
VLEITATRGDSTMEVREEGQTPDLLYRGTIERGQKQRFEGRQLWLRLETPANVVVRLNGNRIKLVPVVKTRGLVISAKRIAPAAR